LKVLADTLVEAGGMGDVQTQLQRNGAERLSVTLDAFGVFVREDIAKWKKVVEFADIKN
jgi:hypothetical protein